MTPTPIIRNRSRFTILAVASAVILSAPVIELAMAAPSAAAPTAPSAVSGHSLSAAQQQATLAYWTPARMKAAIAVDVVTVSPPAVKAVTPADPATRGKAGLSPGGRPEWATDGSMEGTAASPDSPQSFSYPYPYTSFNVPTGDYKATPYLVNGKIFFTNNGSNYVCSGTSIGSSEGSSDENEVWTAGHCVVNTNLSSPGVWDSSAEFIPAYSVNKKGIVKEPFGVFVASNFESATNFIDNGDISVDEGAMHVGTNSSGQTLGQAVGWDGFAWNYSSDEQFVTFGYPAASPYNGNAMVEDIAASASTYTWPSGAGQPLIGIGSPMTGGSSGGAWDIDWTAQGPGYVDGHNDYKFDDQPDAIYSPYQDTLSNTVRCFGASSC